MSDQNQAKAVQEILQGAGVVPNDATEEMTDQVAAPEGQAPKPGAPKPDAPQAATDPLAQIDTGDMGMPGPDASEPLAEGEKPTTIAQAAQALGLTPDELYALEIPLKDGAEPVTLGSMKDTVQAIEGLEAQTVELDERRSQLENEMIVARQQLSSIVELLPTVPPALIEQAQAAHQEHRDRERSAMLAIKPEWRDGEVWERAQGEMLEAVADYGFGRSDLDLVIDHRLTKLLWDFTTLKKRVAEASARFKEVQTTAGRGGKKQSPRQERAAQERATADAAKGGRQSDKVAAVNTILRNSQK